MGQCPANRRKAGGGCAGDQTNAMLAVVQADDESLASPPVAKLALSVACPPPAEPACAGLRREPCFEVISPRRTPALLLRPQAAQLGVFLALRGITRHTRKSPANRRTAPRQGQQGRSLGHPGYRHFRHGAAQ